MILTEENRNSQRKTGQGKN